MDLEEINCPQYVRFSSQSFQDSLINYDTSCSEKASDSLNQESAVEGDLAGIDQENSLAVGSEEARATRSQASKVKKEITGLHFETDNRLKNKDTIGSVNKEKDFVSQLRQHEEPQSTGLGEKPEVKITKPISPAFCTRKRLEKRKLMEEKHEEESVAKKGKIAHKPKQQPKKSKPRPKFVKPVATEIEPFSFDRADKQRYALKEKRIHQEIEKENKPFVFKAQPLPSPSMSTLPKVGKKPITQPEPFNFVLDTRNLHHDVSSKEESVFFKANPATVLKREPFIPEKPQKHSIVIKEFELNTERRASQRLQLLEQKEAEEREKEQIRLARQALEEEKEKQELLKLRQELVHKANPIRQYKTLEIKHSSKQLTEPITPKFETDKRLKVRNDA